MKKESKYTALLAQAELGGITDFNKGLKSSIKKWEIGVPSGWYRKSKMCGLCFVGFNIQQGTSAMVNPYYILDRAKEEGVCCDTLGQICPFAYFEEKICGHLDSIKPSQVLRAFRTKKVQEKIEVAHKILKDAGLEIK